MLLRRTVAIILITALNAVAIGKAWAQSAADADNTLHAMDLRMRALNAARKNLQQMENQRADSEAQATRVITEADATASAAAVKVFTVAFMLTGVKCPEDVRFTQKQFALVVRMFVTTAATELSHVNASLRNVTQPAALAEAVKIREAIVDLRDFLKPFAAPDQT